jgi:hypothetical protein
MGTARNTVSTKQYILNGSCCVLQHNFFRFPAPRFQNAFRQKSPFVASSLVKGLAEEKTDKVIIESHFIDDK